MDERIKNKIVAGYLIGVIAGFLTMMFFVYLIVLPYVSQSYKATEAAGILAGKAEQNSTIANALIIATETCAYNHKYLFTTNGINQLTNNT
jgi:hypothetical protein